MGSFMDWDWVRGTLVWCGFPDPADTRAAILEADPRKAELTEIMELWTAVFAGRSVTVAELGTAMGAEALRHALASSGSGNGQWNAKKVGWWLRNHKDRVIGGRAFRPADANRWKLEGGEL
jgi:hypothetical protein